MVGSGSVIIVSAGEYSEDVTIQDKFAITLSSETPGGKQPFTPAIYGNLTVSGNSSSISVKGVGVKNTILHSSNGSLYLSEMQLGTGNVVGALSKTGSGFLAVQNATLGLTSGVDITTVSVTGSGSVNFSNVALGLLSVSNTSATVNILSDSSSLQANISAGSLNIFDSILYTLANSGSNAIVGTGGVINVRNSIAINPNQTTARLNIGPTTVLAYDDFYFDRPNSNVGINPNITIDFQSIRLANTLTANLLTGTITTAAQPNITSVGTLNSLSVTGNANFSNSNSVNLGPIANIQISGGNSGYVLSTDGAGNLTWQSSVVGAAGSNTQIQFNSNNSFGASSSFTFNNSTSTVQIDGNLVANTMQLGSGLYSWSKTFVHLANSTSNTDQALYSVSAENVSGAEFHIIATDNTLGTRQSTKISSVVYDGQVQNNEYAGLNINGGIGKYVVQYNAGAPPILQLRVTPDNNSQITYKMLITLFAE
jgi:hypothetical protein